jgi:hypothetical protein
VYLIELTLDMTDAELVELMQGMRRIRESIEDAHIICLIQGHDNDPRQLWDIPGVRQLSTRLVELGFIADLDFAPHWDPVLSRLPGQGGLGATEIWLMSQGRFGQTLALTADVLDEVLAVVSRANKRADELLAAAES